MKTIFLNPKEVEDLLDKPTCTEVQNNYALPELDHEILSKFCNKYKKANNLIVLCVDIRCYISPKFHSKVITLGVDYILPFTDYECIVDFVEKASAKKQSEIDSLSKCSLTNLFRRETFTFTLQQQVALHKRNNRPLTLAMVDIDNFKFINDTYGHCFGDEVLKEFSKSLKSELRKSDSVFRYGGEEFSIIFPESTTLGVCEIMNRLHKNVSKHLNNVFNKDITFSCGLFQIVNFDEELENYIDRADKALYDAKRNGKNTYRVYI